MRILLLLDKSGSMSSIKAATIAGFNQFLADQQESPGNDTFTLAQFDNFMSYTFRDVPLLDVAALTATAYRPVGGTALFKSLRDLILTHSDGEPCIVAVLTDGQDTEDRSGQHEREVRGLIETQTAEGWQFIFLGANIDARQYAARLGIDQRYAYQFEATAKGVTEGYATASATTRTMRGTCL